MFFLSNGRVLVSMNMIIAVYLVIEGVYEVELSLLLFTYTRLTYLRVRK